MFEDIVLVHRKQERDSTPFTGVDESHWFLWKTCMRQIAIGQKQSDVHPLFVRKSDDVLEGASAYKFFLEIVCGLHSPVKGETEIMGQFKELVAGVEEAFKKDKESPRLTSIMRFLSAALSDTKAVRETCLRDLGSRSYGSQLRRYVKEARELHVVGAGKLVAEVLPWLCDKVETVVIHCRNVDRAAALKAAYPKIKIQKLGEKTKVEEKQMWIIAAPVSAESVHEIFGANKPQRVIDFRDTSEQDAIKSAAPVLRLRQFFNEMSGTENEAKLHQAKEMISDCVRKRLHAMEIRPFGWEDLCG